MNPKKTLALVLLPLSILVVLNLSGCQPHERVRSPTEKSYDLKGKVVVVEKDKHLLTVAHEDIKDYMPGMTMPFAVGDESAWVFESPHAVAPGDQIAAALIVDGAKSWLEDIVITNGAKTWRGSTGLSSHQSGW